MTGMRRIGIVAVMLVALGCTWFTRSAAVGYQERTSSTPGQAAPRSPLGGMNSFALALLLGGLRGPLVMVLWYTSEDQKTEKNLEDFDTKVEWIRLLQPEFVTVHLFQIWNKAYNISVQMASLPNRYAAILDALDYARSVDQSLPDNINIIHQTAQVYSNKLGTVAQERSYYRRRVRQDSLPREVTGPRLGQEGFQRRRMDPLLDENYRILPEYLVVGHERPDHLPPGAEWYTGAELQFLERYEPFPYGVSTFALAYNYAKRAQVLMSMGDQSPLQLSESVIDSRPALELKAWAEEEWERGRQHELLLYGIKVPAERLEMEEPTASLSPLTPFADASMLAPALHAYERAALLSRDARAEYERHMSDPEYFDKRSIYQSHLETLELIEHMARADRYYLAAAAAFSPGERQELLRKAQAEYFKAIEMAELIILKYYVEDEVVAETYGGTPRLSIADVPPFRRSEILQAARPLLARLTNREHEEDREEFETYIRRAQARLQVIGQ